MPHCFELGQVVQFRDVDRSLNYVGKRESHLPEYNLACLQYELGLFDYVAFKPKCGIRSRLRVDASREIGRRVSG